MKKCLPALLTLCLILTAVVYGASDVEGIWKAGKLTLTIRPDNTYTWQDSRDTMNGEYVLQGHSLTLYYQGRSTRYQASVEGNALLLSDESGNTIRLGREVSSAGASSVPPAGGGDRLYGAWQGQNVQITLTLERTGRFTFGNSAGTFTASDARLIFQDAASGNQSVYEYRFFGQELRLRDAQGNVLALVPAGGAKVGEEPPEEPPPAPPSPLTGRWKCKNADLEVVFNTDGSYVFANDGGTYTVEESKIMLNSRSGQTSAYDYRFFGQELRLRDPQGNVLAFERR